MRMVDDVSTSLDKPSGKEKPAPLPERPTSKLPSNPHFADEIARSRKAIAETYELLKALDNLKQGK